MLTAICLSAAAAHLLVIIVQALLHRIQMGPLATRLAMDVVLVSAPLVRRWTGSVHIASLFVGTAVAIGLPAIALQTGGLTSPMLVTMPLVPLLMSAFVGRRGTLFVGAALLVGVAVVAMLGGATVEPGLRPDLTARGTILVRGLRRSRRLPARARAQRTGGHAPCPGGAPPGREHPRRPHPAV
jgi:hypothetical protein